MEISNKSNIIGVINKYKFYFVLITIIYILLFFSSYSKNINNYVIYINGEKANLSKQIHQIDNKLYIHIDDLTELFKDNTYYDKISAKAIITTDQGVKKILKNDIEYVLILEGDMYINVEKIMSDINYSFVVCKEKIYTFNSNKIEANVVKNRTEVYDGKKVVNILNSEDNVQVVLDDLVSSEESKVVNVVDFETNTYGTCLKENLVYEYIFVDEPKSQDKIIIVKVEDRINNELDADNINAIAIDMLRLSGKNSITELLYELEVDEKLNVFATINNGQNLSNYDPDIISLMLNSDTNREKVNQAILKFVTENNLSGVNINFSNIESRDIDLFTQYVKELSAIMKSSDKQVIVSVSNIQNIDLKGVSKAVDYVIIQAYGERTIASKTSGPISSVNYVHNKIQKVLNENIDVNKLIVEIPTYSVLWTERGGTVINAEIYSMSATEQYVKFNNIEVGYNQNLNQNYFSYTKGITTYKMWLEDSYSLEEKAKLVNKYNLAGISIYKNGMELKSIYKDIVEILKK